MFGSIKSNFNNNWLLDIIYYNNDVFSIMQRFFIPHENFKGDYVVSFDKKLINQIKKVLRAKEGDKFWLFEGSGSEYLGQLIELSNNQVKFLLIDSRLSATEPDTQITLYQALIKADKFEWVLQKAAELGVKKIVPITTNRSLVQQISSTKMKRYQEILKEAIEQCGGAILPELFLPLSFSVAVKVAAQQPGIKMIAWEKEKDNQLITDKIISIFIGPEGGFADEEILLAKDFNIQTVSLGGRILRSETAAISAISRLIIK